MRIKRNQSRLRQAMRGALPLFLGIVLLFGGCAGSNGGSSSSHSPIGDWVVVSHRIPGVSAVSDSAAATWHGTEIHYGKADATSGTKTCAEIRYQFHTSRVDSLLRIGYRIDPKALGFTGSEQSRVGITQLQCAGTPWRAIGGFLIWIDENRVFSIWDGAFFEMQRKGESKK